MTGFKFDAQSVRRIARVVREWEHMRPAPVTLGQQTRSGGIWPVLCQSTGAIATGSSGTCNLVTLDSATETEHSETENTRTLWNILGTKIWDDSLIVALPLSGELVVVVHDSATRLKGLAQGAITGTGSKTIDNLTALDGTYPIASAATTVSAENIHAFDVDDNGEVRLEWNDDDEQWEIYQATCPA